MDSFEDDMFALSDDDLLLSPKNNPVEEHLTKQLHQVQDRVEKTMNDIVEMQETFKRLLKTSLFHAVHGEDISSESDSDLYTIEGEPVIKKTKHRLHRAKQTLVFKSRWHRILGNKWIIGVVLENISKQLLTDLRLYIWVQGIRELQGISTFWEEVDSFWQRMDTIQPSCGEIIGTVVLDIPDFDERSSIVSFGTVSYQVGDEELQTPIPRESLNVKETIDGECALKFSVQPKNSVLALKCCSVERLVGLDLQIGQKTDVLLERFLERNAFKEVISDVYAVMATGSLLYCLLEILPIVDERQASLRISARSTLQLNALLRLLRDEFGATLLEEEDKRVSEAAEALVQELETYLADSTTPSEIQIARLRTDLLIP